MDPIRINDHITIPDHELVFQYVRASGPGGQNVNKVASAVQLFFDAAHSPNLPADVKTRLLALAGKRATNEGVIIIDARSQRTQEQNKKEAVQRLAGFIRQATRRPKPRKRTRPSRAARQRRLDEKRKLSRKKSLRGKVEDL